MKGKIDEKDKDSLIVCFLIFMPLLFLQIFGNKINYQYGAQFGALLAGLVLCLQCFKKLSNKQIVFIGLLFLASSIGTYTKTFKGLFTSKFPGNKCKISDVKLEESQKIKSIIEKSKVEDKILSSGGVIPYVMTANRKIYHFKGFSKVQTSYDYILMEKK